MSYTPVVSGSKADPDVPSLIAHFKPRRLLQPMRKFLMMGVAILLVGALMPLAAQETNYTPEQYKAWETAQKDTNPRTRLQKLDAFIDKPDWVKSGMLPYILQLYLQSYAELKDPAAVVKSCDKVLALPDLDPTTKYQFAYTRTLQFHQAFSERAPDANEQARSAREGAQLGLQTLEQIQKPENVSDGQWAEQKKGPTTLFNYTIGVASAHLKDYRTAVEALETAGRLNPNDAITYYRLGLVYQQMEPTRANDSFWALARSIALRMPDADRIKTYLRNQLIRYQGTLCDSEVDRQLSELLALAQTSAERPADYRFPSAADLTRARENAGAFLGDLKAGGEGAKLVWLSVCGLEFPDVAVKVIDVADNGESTLLKVYRAQFTDPETATKEMEEATEANMEVTVKDQPEAKRVKKDDYVRFTGTLSGYQPEPFLLSWNDAKVNPEDIPAEDAPGKRPTKRPGKRPSR